MGYKNVYTVRQDGGEYEVLKFDKDFEYEGKYLVTKDLRGCDCFASHRATCRHRDLVRLFCAEGKINSGEMYDFDKQRWFAKPSGFGFGFEL